MGCDKIEPGHCPKLITTYYCHKFLTTYYGQRFAWVSKAQPHAILALNYPPPERTVGEAREQHPTARFELLRQSRPDRRGGSCGGPNGHFRPVWRNGVLAAAPIHKDLLYISMDGSPFASRCSWPLTASHGQFFCRNWPI